MHTKYPNNFFGIIKIIYGISGIWLFSPKGYFLLKYLKYLWSFVLYSCAISFVICELMMMDEIIKDLNKIVMQVGMWLSNILATLKVLVLIGYHQRLVDITKTMQDEKYHYECVENFNPGEIMADGKRFTTRFSTVLLILYSFVGISPHVTTVVALNRDVRGNNFGENITCYHFMPYTFFIPFPSDTKLKCQIVALYMDIAISGVALSIACFDTFYGALLNCLAVQFTIVNEAFKTIRQRVLRRLGLPQNYMLFRDDENPRLEKELYTELVFTTQHFMVLLRVAEDLEEIFNLVILGQTVECLLIFSTCVYIATTVPISSPEFAAASQYFAAVFVQVTLFCWFGRRVTTASEEILFSLYDCDWYSASKRFKSTMLVTMTRMQRPVYFTLGKFYPLTLDSLVSVCQGSFSYYALFKSINE